LAAEAELKGHVHVAVAGRVAAQVEVAGRQAQLVTRRPTDGGVEPAQLRPVLATALVADVVAAVEPAAGL
ncbi:hypothetical protein, partial [Gordonia sp. VNK21]|uniref:hypothetical protein n=1 Tax=Gordonia sp. VNK21 TaxID=3382483 RepID=UPI0038D3D54B